MCQRGQGGRAGAWAGESPWLVGASRVQLGLRWPQGLAKALRWPQGPGGPEVAQGPGGPQVAPGSCEGPEAAVGGAFWPPGPLCPGAG